MRYEELRDAIGQDREEPCAVPECEIRHEDGSGERGDGVQGQIEDLHERQHFRPRSSARERFDLVGLDPRGVGMSTPAINCYTDRQGDGDAIVSGIPAGGLWWTEEATHGDGAVRGRFGR